MTQPSLPLESAAPSQIEWSGKLSELLPVLTAEARVAGDGAWKFRHLRHGALVAVQLEADGRRLVRIARADKPQGDRAWGMWATELTTFEKHLGIAGWQRSDEEAAGVAVRYLELWRGEIAPGKAACGRCGKGIAFDLVWGSRQRCESCARLDGDDETREILGGAPEAGAESVTYAEPRGGKAR